MSANKWEKRIIDNDIKNAIENCDIDEITDMCDAYTLQYFKDQQLRDADFEIIEPLQLPSPTTKTNDI